VESLHYLADQKDETF